MSAWLRLRSVELAGVLAGFRLPWIALSEEGKFWRHSRREGLSVSDSARVEKIAKTSLPQIAPDCLVFRGAVLHAEHCEDAVRTDSMHDFLALFACDLQMPIALPRLPCDAAHVSFAAWTRSPR